MTSTAKLEKIMEALNGKRTVYVQTCTRATKITLKNVLAFEKAGRPLFRDANGSLYMSVGKNYDCIDYCHITVQ